MLHNKRDHKTLGHMISRSSPNPSLNFTLNEESCQLSMIPGVCESKGVVIPRRKIKNTALYAQKRPFTEAGIMLHSLFRRS